MHETTKKERNAPDTSTKGAAAAEIMPLRDRQLLSSPIVLGPKKQVRDFVNIARKCHGYPKKSYVTKIEIDSNALLQPVYL